MKKNILLSIICLLFFALPACSSHKKTGLHQESLNKLSAQISSLQKELSNTNQNLVRREAELESIRFELGVLRKEILDLRSPSTSPEQSQSERLNKLIQELSNPLCDTNKLAFELRKFGKRATVALLEVLKKPDIQYRSRVEKTFSGLLSEDTTSFLLPSLNDPILRISIARILGDLKDYSAANELSNYLNAENNDFLFVVAEALVKLKDKRGIPLLIEYLKKTDLNKRAIAYNLLNKISGLTMDYKYYGKPSEVLEGTKKWEDWWIKNASSFIFPIADSETIPKLVK